MLWETGKFIKVWHAKPSLVLDIPIVHRDHTGFMILSLWVMTFCTEHA